MSDTEAVDWNAKMREMRELRANRTKIGPGEHPAVMVIDYQVAFTQHGAIGETTKAHLENTAVLLDAARDAGIPVIYAKNIIDALDDRMLAQRVRSTLTARCLRDDPWSELDPIVASKPGDEIVDKTRASAFYQTRLDELLAELGVDELLFAGTSTSGCVRATVVDAAFRDYHIEVVEDCVDDFRALSGEASLWDIQDRFGDVVDLDWALGRIASYKAAKTGAEVGA
ncbi:MAG TPA: isochorismatase family protein [Gryllotalpicola sp.]